MKYGVLALLLVLPLPAAAQSLGSETGLPLPRFESLRFNEVNLRRGAGEDYPIAWTFVRRGLPVEVFQEFGDWRHVRDHDGATGWIKRTQLSAERSALVQDAETPMLSEPGGAGRVVARAAPGVVLSLSECALDWCRAKAGGYRGWVRKGGLWGVREDDVFED